MLAGSYDAWLVAASLLMAMLASYTALDMVGRVAAAQGRTALSWLLGGSVAMGIGIWSMHFLGMLAFHLPIAMGYDTTITLLSLLIAIASSAFALWLVCRERLSWRRLAFGSLLMGAGVCAMHYSGMAAMRMTPAIQYDPSLFSLSVLIAVTASGAALWIAFQLRRRSSRVRTYRAGAAVVMGIAIAGMHYTGMAAARFPAGSVCRMANTGVTSQWMALLIIIFGLAVLSIALIASVLDSRLESRTAMLASSLTQANLKLQFMTMHDGLTKLPNRAMLVNRLEEEVRNARRAKTRFAVLYLDLDGFKEVNDVFGHHAGDLMLLEAALRIRAVIRNEDTLARIGSDEFALLVDVIEPSDAAGLAERLVATIRDPFVLAGDEVRITASIGISVYCGKEGNAEELLKNAEAAMYKAKDAGRDSYCFFEKPMNDEAQDYRMLLQDLRQAQAQGEFTLFYQPKFDAAHGTLIGAEALLRWKHPTRGSIPPDRFIPLAEKSGLIIPIGTWVLNEACRQMSAWREAGNRNWTISVNLSAMQFNHLSLVDTVRAALESHALEPRLLTLEITESTAMRDADAGMIILQQLHEMGVRTSIDDFGTGYSSLLYLKRLHASELKIDRGFVRDLPQDNEDAAIVGAIVALGRTLNLDVVAEGVETQEQLDFLTRLGCNSLQGYLLGRPMPAEEFIEASRNKPAFRARTVRPISLMTA